MTRKAADSSNLPPCPPPPSVHPPSCDIIATTSQQDVTVINGQATRSASYSKDPNVTNQISMFPKWDSPCDLFLPSPEVDPFLPDSTLTSARETRSGSGGSGDHNDTDVFDTDAFVFEHTDFDAPLSRRLNSETTHLTNSEAEAKQPGFEHEEVQNKVAEVIQPFRQKSLRNEMKNMVDKKIVLDYRNQDELLLCESDDIYFVYNCKQDQLED